MPGTVDPKERAEALMLHRSGQLRRAEMAYRGMLARLGVDAEVMDLLAVLLGQQARHDEALELHRGAVRSNPGSARYQANLGTTLGALGRHEEAIQAFSAACSLEPDRADLHADLGSALAQLCRHEEAVARFLTGLRCDSRLPAAWIGLGRSQHALGKLAEALQSFRQAATLEPGNAVAHANCGAVLSELGEHSAAVQCCRLAVSCDPGLAAAHVNLAAALLAAGSPAEAAEASQQAIAIDPRLPEAHRGLADARYAMGHPGEAIRSLERTCEIAPEDLDALCNLGRLRLETGEIAGAEHAYRRALAASPSHGPAWIGLTESRRFGPDDPDLATLASLHGTQAQDVRDRIDIGFAYAKACEDAGQFAIAGAALVEANALARSKIRYDVADDERRMREIERTVDQSLIDGWAQSACDSSHPIFIVGMPRSGTSLLEQMLSSHPMVHGAGELAALPQLLLRELPAGRPDLLRVLGPEAVSRICKDYLRTLDRLNSEARHVTDKLTANFQHLGLIASIFPAATILHCERDALDTCWSCFQKPFSGSQPWSYDRVEIARYYRAYRGLMDHWGRMLPGRLITVRYETLVMDAEHTLRELLDRCHLPWDAACLRYFLNRRPVRTASASQVRLPLYATAIGRSRRYQDFLSPLESALGDLVGSRHSASAAS